MSLENLKKKLYQQRKNKQVDTKVIKPWLMQTPSIDKKATLDKPVQPMQKPVKKKKSKKKFFVFFIVVISLLLILASGLAFISIWQNRHSFDDDKLELKIEAIDKITSGDQVLYRIVYHNKSQTLLKDLEMTFYFPDGSLIESGQTMQSVHLADLGPGQQNSIEFKAVLVGNKGEFKKARAVLSFQPANVSSRLQKEVQATIEIFHQPLILDIELPERISRNQPFNFSIECLNTSEVDFFSLAIKLSIPAEFEIVSSQPLFDDPENNLWLLSSFGGGEKFKINLQAKTSKEEGEMISLKTQIGRWQDGRFDIYTETIEKTQITQPALLIKQTINDSKKEYIASPGQILNFKLHYQNTTDIAISGIVIKAKFEGRLFDFESLSAQDSFFDRASQTITWNSRSKDELTLLGASEDGEIKFSIKLNSDLPIRNFSDQNFMVSSQVTCDSEKIPFDLRNLPILGEDKTEVKIRTNLTLEAKGYYRDSPIANTGPIPPKPNEKTTYTIVWQSMNLANDVENLEVRAKLPGHVTWENIISPTSEDLGYNSLTGEVVWRVDKLLANTGILRPVRQAAFQVSITPADNHVGQTLTLLGQSRAQGLDSFTQEEVSDDDDSINTSLPDDFMGQPDKGVVSN